MSGSGSTPTAPVVSTSGGTVVVPPNIDADGNLTGSQDLTGDQDAPTVGHLGAKGPSASNVVTDAGAGAVTGAALGSVVPGVGTAVGGLVGGAVGAVAGFFGGGDTRDAVEKALRACDIDSLKPKIAAWRSAESLLRNLHSSLSDLKPGLDQAWRDDIGKRASKRVGDIAGSAANLAVAARKNGDALQTLYDTIKPVKDRFGHGDSVTSDIGNFVTGGRDDESLHAYNAMIDAINRQVLPKYPQSVDVTLNGQTSNINTGTASPNLNGVNPNAGAGPGGGGTPPHLANPTMPKIANPNKVHTPPDPHFVNPHPTTVHPTGPGTLPDPTINQNPPFDPGGPGGYPGPGTGIGPDPSLIGVGGAGSGQFGSGAGGFGVDSGASLAGFDSSGAGAGGIDGLTTGNGLDAGLNGVGSGAGSAGAVGAGGLGAGGAGAGGSSAGGAGRGMMGPMMGGRGAGGAGDEDERERTTWLSEDDDVWGGSDAPSGTV